MIKVYSKEHVIYVLDEIKKEMIFPIRLVRGVMRRNGLCFQVHGIMHMSFLGVLALPQQNIGL